METHLSTLVVLQIADCKLAEKRVIVFLCDFVFPSQFGVLFIIVSQESIVCKNWSVVSIQPDMLQVIFTHL